MPVGATIATDEVASSMTGLSISTFGGNPVSMAATEATLGVMEEENIPARSARLGNKLREALVAFGEDHQFIGDVRGMGLMQAIELVEDRKTKEPAAQKTNALMEAAKREGLLLGKGGRWGNVIRIAPPDAHERHRARRRHRQARPRPGHGEVATTRADHVRRPGAPSSPITRHHRPPRAPR